MPYSVGRLVFDMTALLRVGTSSGLDRAIDGLSTGLRRRCARDGGRWRARRGRGNVPVLRMSRTADRCPKHRPRSVAGPRSRCNVGATLPVSHGGRRHHDPALAPQLAAVVVGAVALVTTTGCTEATGPGASTTSSTAGGPAAAGPAFSAQSVQAAIAALDAIVTQQMTTTTVPGVAVGVIHDGKLLTAKGFGVREVGKDAKVDADTVFQLASVSKALGSTAVAAAVTSGKVAWSDPVEKGLPGFTLADPWVSTHVTVGDMYAHRSGLPEHAGDILEDLGFSQEEIFARLRQEPLLPFREMYDYTNYGLTAGGVAAARSAGTTWDQLTQDSLLKPLGMTSTTDSFASWPSARTGPHCTRK